MRFCAKLRGTFVYAGVVGGLLAGAMAARADSVLVTATFNNSQPNSVATTLTSNYNDGNEGASTTTVSTVAGVYGFTVDSIVASSGTPNSPLTGSEVQTALGNPGNVFGAVCIDFTHNIHYGETSSWYVENLTSLATGGGPGGNGVGINTNQANAIGYLWNNFYTPNDASADAAFQMAVWDVVYDGGGTSLSTGSPAPTVSYSDTVDANTAQGWAQTAQGAVLNSTNPYTADNVYALVNTDNTQSFNFAIAGTFGGGTPPTPTPLPAAFGSGLLGLGILGLSLAWMKRRRVAT